MQTRPLHSVLRLPIAAGALATVAVVASLLVAVPAGADVVTGTNGDDRLRGTPGPTASSPGAATTGPRRWPGLTWSAADPGPTS